MTIILTTVNTTLDVKYVVVLLMNQLTVLRSTPTAGDQGLLTSNPQKPLKSGLTKETNLCENVCAGLPKEHNLISSSQLCDANFKVLFTKTQETIFNQYDEVVLIAPRRRYVYVIDMSPFNRESNACFFAKASPSPKHSGYSTSEDKKWKKLFMSHSVKMMKQFLNPSHKGMQSTSIKIDPSLMMNFLNLGAKLLNALQILSTFPTYLHMKTLLPLIHLFFRTLSILRNQLSSPVLITTQPSVNIIILNQSTKLGDSDSGSGLFSMPNDDPVTLTGFETSETAANDSQEGTAETFNDSADMPAQSDPLGHLHEELRILNTRAD
ncbi:hypothetical protein Tco_1204924 [Tanacetum coccineum]